MALNKNKLETDLKQSMYDAANVAFLKSMSISLDMTNLKKGQKIGDYASQLRILQAKTFAEEFSKLFAPKLANHINEFVKSGDVNITGLSSIFSGNSPGLSDGGAYIVSQMLTKAQSFDTNPKNGNIR